MTDTGGPAFPCGAATWNADLCQWVENRSTHTGLTWLDYAAIKIMAVLSGEMPTTDPYKLAEWAYDAATALLAEKHWREQGVEQPKGNT